MSSSSLPSLGVNGLALFDCDLIGFPSGLSGILGVLLWDGVFFLLIMLTGERGVALSEGCIDVDAEVVVLAPVIP